MAEKVIEFENVTKKYGSFVAVENITLSIEKGESIGILGPNGAGKTTLVSIISTLRRPTYGKVYVNGIDVSKSKLDAVAHGVRQHHPAPRVKRFA